MISHPTSVPTTLLTPDDRKKLGRRAQMLAGTTVIYNAVEAVFAIGAGMAASSIALIGFGLSSITELLSGSIILWQFRHKVPEEREKQALRMLAVAFFALAAYISFEAVRTLLLRKIADTSKVGIAIAILSLIIMPFLSVAQRRTGKRLGSKTVVADSKQTLLCTYLSAVLLLGLVLNAAFGWWWADPLVGLIVAALAIYEGHEAWIGEVCNCA